MLLNERSHWPDVDLFNVIFPQITKHDFKIEFVQNYGWPIQVEGRGNLVILIPESLPDFLI